MIKKLGILLVVTITLLVCTFGDILLASASVKNEPTYIEYNGIKMKVAKTYEEYKNAKEPVAIDPSILTEKQKNEINNSQYNPKETINYAVAKPPSGGSTCSARTTTWTRKITNNELSIYANVANIVAYVGAILSRRAEFKDGVTVAALATNVVIQYNQLRGYSGLKVSGVTKRYWGRLSPYTPYKCIYNSYATSVSRYK